MNKMSLVRVVLACHLSLSGASLFANIVAQSDESGKAPRDAFGNIIKRDPRGSLYVLGPRLGIAQSEIKLIAATIGKVSCPSSIDDTRNDLGAEATGFIIGGGNYVATSAHVFINNGALYRPFSECYFVPFATPNLKKVFDFSIKDNHRFFTEYPIGDPDNDIAIVKLKSKSASSSSLKIDYPGEVFGIDQELLIMSAIGLRMQKPVSENIPIAQACKVKALAYRPNYRIFDGLYTDCAGTPGESGSPVLIRRNGQLMVRGILTSSIGDMDASYDYLEFNVDPKAGPLSFTHMTEFTGKIGGEISDFIFKH